MFKFSTTILLLCMSSILYSQNYFQCGQEDTHNRLLKENPTYKLRQEQIENNYLNVINDLIDSKSKSSSATYTIPVVFHVMHNPGDAVGQGTNISLSRIQTELANWNLAFDNTGAYAGGPDHCDAGVMSSDVDINFCLATQDPLGFPTDGVERYSYPGASPLYKNDPSPNTGYLEHDMKEISHWDTKNYLNVWIVDNICQTASNPGSCGVVGYATLPGASGFFFDGVVVQDDFVGTNVNNSKVMVHELGHYLNLFHTFQSGCSSGSCLTSGDRVCDTPLDNTPNVSDPNPYYVNCNDPNNNTTNTCSNDATIPDSPFTTDVQDMYENYMDYSPLQCTNTFTPNQAARMEAVMMSGGGREEMNSSTGCSSPSVNNTQVAFSISELTVSEAAANTDNGCLGYSTFKLKVKISMLPSSNVTLNFTTSGSATSGIDYDLVSSSVTFNTTGDLYKYFDIRINNDAAIEGTETIVISYTISGPAIAASENQSLTLKLKDNDVIPGQIFLEEDFENGSPGWISSAFGPLTDNRFVVGTNSDLTNNAAYVTNDISSKPFEYDNSLVDSPLLISPEIDGTNMQEATLTFEYQANGSGDDYGRLVYKKTSSNIFNPFGPPFTDQGNSVNSATVEIPSDLYGETFVLGFNWVNNGNNSGQNPPFAIDNVIVSSQIQDIGQNLNTTSEEYLGPNETVLFYSDNNEIIAQIKNTSSHDYGCTSITIDRSGTGATNGTGDYSTNQFLDKTILVTPTTNSSSGSYEISLYYKESEIAGWESETGLSRNDLSMVKSTGSIGNAQSSNSEVVSFVQNEYGDDWAYTASFNTGFSGFGFSSISLPLELQSFDARFIGEDVELQWLTMNEIMMDKIIVEKSKDGKNFEEFNHVQPQGMIRNNYQLIDKNPFKGMNYYRLKFLNLDGSFSYSNIVSLRKDSQFDVVIYPNPIAGKVIQLKLFSELKQQFSYFVYNIEGKLILENVGNNIDQHGKLDIPFGNQEAGLYYIKVIQGDQVKVVRFFNN